MTDEQVKMLEAAASSECVLSRTIDELKAIIKAAEIYKDEAAETKNKLLKGDFENLKSEKEISNCEKIVFQMILGSVRIL